MISIRSKNQKFNLALGLIAVLALILRVWGMWFGLPVLVDPDAPVFVNGAMHLGSARTLNPGWFGHPSNILMYLLFVEFLGYYLIGYTFGWFESVKAFADYYHADPTVIYMIGRSISILAGTLSVFAIGRLGKRLINARVGLGAALFLAVDPLSVRYSKIIRGDILGTLLIILAIYYGLKFWDSRRQRYAIFSAITIGLATAAKYPFVTTAIVILLLAFFLWRERPESVWQQSQRRQFPWKFLLVNCFVIVLSFFCLTPFFFFDFHTAWQDLLVERQGAHLGYESMSLLQNYWWYISSVLYENSGLPILLGVGLGLFVTLLQIDKRKALVMTFPLLFFIAIGTLPTKWASYVIPIIPFIGLYAAMALDTLLSRISSKIQQKQKSRVMIKLAAPILLLLLFFHPLKESMAFNRRLALPDTRQFCREWIKKHIPKGKFVQEFYTFQPYPPFAYLIGEFEFEEYSIYQDFSIANKTLEEYQTKGVTHLIVSNWIYERYLAEADRYSRQAQFYRTLLEMVPVKTFEGNDGMIKGPRIAIYAITDTTGKNILQPEGM